MALFAPISLGCGSNDDPTMIEPTAEMEAGLEAEADAAEEEMETSAQ